MPLTQRLPATVAVLALVLACEGTSPTENESYVLTLHLSGSVASGDTGEPLPRVWVGLAFEWCGRWSDPDDPHPPPSCTYEVSYQAQTRADGTYEGDFVYAPFGPGTEQRMYCHDFPKDLYATFVQGDGAALPFPENRVIGADVACTDESQVFDFYGDPPSGRFWMPW
jgi:hypothetical protein